MIRTDLSEAARVALDRAARNGGWICAGTNVIRGRVERTNAGTLRALVARDLAVAELSPEGGMAVRLTAAGSALARTA